MTKYFKLILFVTYKVSRAMKLDWYKVNYYIFLVSLNLFQDTKNSVEIIHNFLFKILDKYNILYFSYKLISHNHTIYAYLEKERI